MEGIGTVFMIKHQNNLLDQKQIAKLGAWLCIHYYIIACPMSQWLFIKLSKYQRTIGPENAHLKPDPGVHVLSHHEMTLTLNTQTPLLNS